MPYFRGQHAASHFFHGTIIVIANPHAGDQIGRKTHKPGIAVIRCRTGFPGDRAADARRLSGAILDDIHQHLIHFANDAGV